MRIIKLLILCFITLLKGALMPKIHWIIILIALIILLFALRSCIDQSEEEGIVVVNCPTDSLAEKIRNIAKAGDTVKIMGDCHEGDSVIIDKDITLDGNKNTISGTTNKDVIIINNATVTLKNITVTKGKHGIVSKNSIVFAENLIARENNGVGIIVVGKTMKEKKYNKIIDSMIKITTNPIETDNELFSQSSNRRISTIAKNQTVCSLSKEQIEAANLPIFKMSCGESRINSGGIFIADDTKGCFGYGSTPCTIEVSHNPWGIYARNANMAIGDATLAIHHNNTYGVGLALKNAVLTGNGRNTAFASMTDQPYNFSKQCGDTTTNIDTKKITLTPQSIGQCLNLP